MGKQTFGEILAVQRGAGPGLLATYTTAKSVIDANALVVLPANYWYVGRGLLVKVTGAISNIVTTPGLMNFQVKMGPTANIAVFDTGNIQLNATAHTTLPFYLEILMTCRAIGNGTSANFMGLAMTNGLMFTRTAGQTDDAQDMQGIVAPATNPAVGTGFDSTVASILDIWVGFTISNAGNGVRIDQYTAIDLPY